MATLEAALRAQSERRSATEAAHTAAMQMRSARVDAAENRASAAESAARPHRLHNIVYQSPDYQPMYPPGFSIYYWQ